jgi:hypothetical protein
MSDQGIKPTGSQPEFSVIPSSDIISPGALSNNFLKIVTPKKPKTTIARQPPINIIVVLLAIGLRIFSGEITKHTPVAMKAKQPKNNKIVFNLLIGISMFLNASNFLF